MMKLDGLPSSSSFADGDESNLQKLLEAFGSSVSLEDIASSYCKAGKDLNYTEALLCNLSSMQEQKQSSDGESSRSSSAALVEESGLGKLKKMKKHSASIGTVSSLIGKDYINPRRQPKGFEEKWKPVKLNSSDFPVTEIWGEEKVKEESGIVSEGGPNNNDIIDFVYNMLGKGFQLDKEVIQQVIGQCGYNMPMIIDKLVDMSTDTQEKSDDVIHIAAVNNMKNIHNVESTSGPKQSQPLRCSGSDASGGNESKLPQTETKSKDMEREVLEALFSVRDKIGDHHESTRPVKTCGQSPYGRIVAKPLEDKIIEDFTFITRKPINDRNNEANEESYDELRKAKMENLATMKEYYKASADAFIKKEFETSQNLLEQGNFYKRMADEADEKSSQKLIDNSDEDEEICINVHYFEPRQALYHMRLNLTNFCGLPSVRSMKVVVGTSGDKKDERRKRLITKLLEKEGIPWTEEGNGWIILVQVDEIDPNNLSFANK